MNLIEDIVRTFLGHDEDILETDEYEDSTKRVLGNDLACEQAIIKCQMTHGRLRTTTTRLCRAKFGKDATKRAYWKIAMRKKRGKSAVNDMEHELVNLITKILDIKKKQKIMKNLEYNK